MTLPRGETLSAVPPSSTQDHEPDFAPAEHAGEVGRLGRYRVLKQLGRGGMGAVFLGFDARLDRKVALKVILPHYAAKPEARERFLREARTAAMVKSDHVVTIFDVGEERGIPFIAMEYLLGYPLDKYLKTKGELPQDQMLRVGRETALGLAAAHELGLVHRDIKPGNLWLEVPRGRVKLLDFGLARVENDDVHLTHSGAVVGTPAYMSPEQGRGEKVDHRSDLFSLGVMLYRLSTGAMPFRGSSTMAILTSLAVDTPTPVRQLNPELPDALEAVIGHLLAKDPAHRYQSAMEVVEALRDVEHPRTGSGPLPVPVPVQPVPMVISVQTQNVWDGIDQSLSEPQIVASGTQAMPLPQAPKLGQRNRKLSLWPVALAGAVLLAAGATLATVMSRAGKKEPEAVAENSEPKEKARSGGKQLQPAETDPDRKAAEFVLSIGGSVKVNGEEQDIKTKAELPKLRFTLTGVNLLNNKNVTDAGLASFKGCKNLIQLTLWGTNASDEGLNYFKDCSSLEILLLQGTQVTDKGLAYFKDCKNLSRLSLEETGVGEAGLACFKDCRQLTGLGLRGTKISASKILEFAKSHPRCKVDHNGGIIEPTADPNYTAAEYVLSVGGSVRINGETKDIKTAADLPKEPFFLTEVGLGNNKRVTDEGLASFAGCRYLTSLTLHNTKITDTGLKNFKDCKNLTLLNLHDTGVTSKGLAHFAGCANLDRLWLHNTQVTDEGLTPFKSCKGLLILNVGNTKVTTKGVEAFHQAVPGCKIELEGGFVAPRK